MKRKPATAFGKSNRDRLKPPYLSSEEHAEFEMEFTLFGQTVDLKQLLATANSHKDKFLTEFVSELILKDSKLNFQAYLQEIEQFFNDKPTPQRNDILFHLLDEDAEGQLSLERFRRIMMESGEEQLTEQQATKMLSSITGNNGPVCRLTREKFSAVIAHRPTQP